MAEASTQYAALLKAMIPVTMLTESRGRRFDDSGRLLTSYRGARGEMQVLDSTALKPGFGIRPASVDSTGDINNDERARVGRELLGKLLDKYSGDPAKAWAAYHSGHGTVDKAIAEAGDGWLEKLGPAGRQYVQLNTERLGDNAPGGVFHFGTSKRLSAILPRPEHVGPFGAFDLDVRREYDDYLKYRKEVEASTIRERAQDTIQAGIGFTGAAVVALSRPDFDDVPGYRPPLSELQHLDAAELDSVLSSVGSPQELNYRLAEIDVQRAARKRLATSDYPIASGLAASFISDLPFNVVSAGIVGRAFQAAGVGGRVLAMQGRQGAAVASTLAEQTIPGIVATGAEHFLVRPQAPSEWALNIAADAVLGTAFEAPELVRSGMLRKELDGIADAAERAVVPEPTAATVDQQTAPQTQYGDTAAPGGQVNVGQQSTDAAAQHVEGAPTNTDGVSAPTIAVGATADQTPAAGTDNIRQDAVEAARLWATSAPQAQRLPIDTASWAAVAVKRQDPQEVARIRTMLEGTFPEDTLRSLFSNGRVRVVGSEADLPKAIHGKNVQAVYDPLTDTTFIVADRVTKDNIYAVVLHDVGVHHGLERAIGPDAFNSALNAVEDAVRRGEAAAVAADAAARRAGSGYILREERLAYYLEYTADSPPSWVGTLVAKVRAFLRTLGAHIDISSADLHYLARGAVRRVAEDRTFPKRAYGVLWHGGPVKGIDRLSTQYVATGEGRIAYGWGLYFSDSRWVSEWYRGKESMRRNMAAEDGGLYRVRVHADSGSFLDWDAPVGKQSTTVRDALSKLGVATGRGADAYMALVRMQQGDTQLARAKRASEALAALGVVGTRYKGGSRSLGEQGRPTNYVMFTDAVVDIEQRFSLAPVAVDTVSPDVGGVLADPIARKYGVDTWPLHNVDKTAAAKQAIALLKEADNPAAPWNNVDPARVDSMLKYAPRLASPGLILMRSKHPAARMFGWKLLEKASFGRPTTTAAMDWHTTYGHLVGAFDNQFRVLYEEWARQQGASGLRRIYNDYAKGDLFAQFNAEVHMEIEYRGRGSAGPVPPSDAHPAVKAAADLYSSGPADRARTIQIDTRTPGWEAMPETSVGYFTRRLSPEVARTMRLDGARYRAAQAAIGEQFIDIWGDSAFAGKLAGIYLERAVNRAIGGQDGHMDVFNPSVLDEGEELLKAAGLTDAEVHSAMKKWRNAAQGHTKKRLQLDLLREYPDGKGGTFRLFDLYDHDVTKMVHVQAHKVAADVALTKHGVAGYAGLKSWYTIIGETGNTAAGIAATADELRAVRQTMAEFYGMALDGKVDDTSPVLTNATLLTSLMRLAGMAWTQLGDVVAVGYTLGLGSALRYIPEMRRLRQEVIALANGQTVDNSLLHHVEQYSGGFGSEAYINHFPFASVDPADISVAAGQHPGLVGRLLRGGMQSMAKLSFWRAIHATQQRFVAEQIVLKSLRFARDIETSPYLRKNLDEMGIKPWIVDELRKGIGTAIKFGPDGKVQFFNPRLLENQAAADAYIQAVHGGVGQIIQGHFIGERGVWVHDAYMRLMLQYMQFPLLAMEKQWTRFRAAHGLATTLGIMLGSTLATMPLYYARVLAQSVGREDREEYLERRLHPASVAKAAWGYTAVSGLAPTFLESILYFGGGLAEGTPLETLTGPGASRTGGEGFIGGQVAPAVGAVNDLLKALGNDGKPGVNWQQTAKAVPLYPGLPYFLPVVNMLPKGDDDPWQ